MHSAWILLHHMAWNNRNTADTQTRSPLPTILSSFFSLSLSFLSLVVLEGEWKVLIPHHHCPCFGSMACPMAAMVAGELHEHRHPRPATLEPVDRGGSWSWS
jgi:hypothetical protein